MLVPAASPGMLRELHSRFAAPDPHFHGAQMQLMRKTHGQPHHIAVETSRARFGRQPHPHGSRYNTLHGMIDGSDDSTLDLVRSSARGGPEHTRADHRRVISRDIRNEQRPGGASIEPRGQPPPCYERALRTPGNQLAARDPGREPFGS